MTNPACLVQPIIRYRMSDSVIFHDEPCGCGLTTPYIEIDGRVEDILEFERNGTVIRVPGIMLFISVKEVPVFDHCQFIQRSHYDLELRVTTLSTHDEASVKQDIVNKISSIMADYGPADVKIALADEPPMRTKSGKMRISHRAFQRI